ncbi:MAG: DUF72 domain-containing protein [Candidatus Velthaea sp.]
MQLEFPIAHDGPPAIPPILVGTCGYSYKDWIGTYYPPRTKPSSMLSYYAAHFHAVEIDSTYYRVPAPNSFATMVERTPPHFRFAVKLPGSATHVPRGGTPLPTEIPAFREAIEPLVRAGRLSCALMQFPHSFAPSPAAEKRLAELRDALADIALVAEFRNRAWQTHDTLALLESLGVGWCNVDEPQFSKLLRPSADVVGPIAYVRFHGRNYQQWWNAKTGDLRYDYLYTAEELEPWAQRLVDLRANADVREVLAFFNNHRRGQAVRNAEMLSAMLETRLRQ